MNRARIALTALGLAGTGLLLLASAGNPGRVCTHPVQTVRYAAAGSCGPAGELTVTAQADSCSVAATGAEALGLPPSGVLGNDLDLNAGGWVLSGTIVADVPAADGGSSDAGASTSRQVLRTCTAAAIDGGVRLACNPSDSAAAGRCDDTLRALR